MSPSIVTVVAPSLDPIDDDALCAACGRQGTWAVLAIGSPPHTITRYCGRCWPAAHAAALAADDGERDRINGNVSEWMQSDPATRASEPDLSAGQARFMSYHPLLAPGSLYREWRHARRD
jgi:hypothetical protein